jgi:hypothetical protein
VPFALRRKDPTYRLPIPDFWSEKYENQKKIDVLPISKLSFIGKSSPLNLIATVPKSIVVCWYIGEYPSLFLTYHGTRGTTRWPEPKCPFEPIWQGRPPSNGVDAGGSILGLGAAACQRES